MLATRKSYSKWPNFSILTEIRFFFGNDSKILKTTTKGSETWPVSVVRFELSAKSLIED